MIQKGGSVSSASLDSPLRCERRADLRFRADDPVMSLRTRMKGTSVEPKIRESTLGIGFRKPLLATESVWLLGMGGRCLVTVTLINGQPTWIGSIGFQILTGKHRRSSGN
jgi:hypothetical protein